MDECAAPRLERNLVEDRGRDGARKGPEPEHPARAAAATPGLEATGAVRGSATAGKGRLAPVAVPGGVNESRSERARGVDGGACLIEGSGGRGGQGVFEHSPDACRASTAAELTGRTQGNDARWNGIRNKQGAGPEQARDQRTSDGDEGEVYHEDGAADGERAEGADVDGCKAGRTKAERRRPRGARGVR